MKVDFLIFHSETTELMEVLIDSLSQAYEDNYAEPPDIEKLQQSVTICYSRRRIQTQENENSVEEYFICGFSADLDTENENVGEKLVKDFCQELAGNDEFIKHILKLNDPYLRKINQKYADEIFEIEMKLREAISLIFLDTYGGNFYNLLTEVNVKPLEKDLKTEQMQVRWENEFFYLLFSDYIKLNERKQPNSTKDLIQLIGHVEDYEAFKNMLTSKPIRNEEYKDFLASLQTHVDPIEKLRNCVAHNRTIPQKVINNYETAKEPLLKSIDDMFSKKSEDNHRMFWEEEVCEDLKAALETARWNIEEGSVKIYKSHDETYCTCHSYDELIEELQTLASDTASVYMPFDGGEPVFDYEPYDDVADVLAEYEEQIRELGWDI